MDYFSEGRLSDSPYIEMIWQGRVQNNYAPVCPADTRWNLLITRQNGKVRVCVEGATTQAVFKYQPEGGDFFVIKFKLGTFMPYLLPRHLLNGDSILPQAAHKSFWLNGFAWEFPDYDNAEVFVERLVHNDLLIRDPVVKAVLQNEPQDMSFRTVRRRFLHTTGLTYNAIQQIELAQRANVLLEQGISILDTVDQAGYADQPHLTRSMKRFIGFTPSQIARVKLLE